MLHADNQNALLKMLIGGKYLGPVKQVLAPEAARKSSAIDIGCGSCAWWVPSFPIVDRHDDDWFAG
jgi:hypothetical protein